MEKGSSMKMTFGVCVCVCVSGGTGHRGLGEVVG